MKITTRLQKYFTWQLTSQIPPEVGCLAPVFLQFYRGRILTNPRMKRIPFFLFLFFLKFLYNILTWMINERQGSTSWRPAAQFIINKCCNPIKSFSIVPHYQCWKILTSMYIVFIIFKARFVLIDLFNKICAFNRRTLMFSKYEIGAFSEL